jgi:alpha-1,6-mannosyltransferase
MEAGVRDPVALPLGVDVGMFQPRSDEQKQAVRRRLGLPSNARLLVFAGRPAREKRIDVLVEAVELLGEPYKLVLVGAGQAVTTPSSQVISLPYESDPEHLVTLMGACDAFAHANDAEPFGLVVLEAMACGLPVVGVGSGGVAESVDETVGQLADRSEPAAFAAAIEALFERDLWALGQAARARAVERHGWDAVFTRLCEVYAETTGDSAFTTRESVLAMTG